MPDQIRARRHTTRTSAALLLSITGGVSLLSWGCSSSPRPIYTSGAAYDGPPVAITADAGQHVIVLTAPTSGWSLSLDCTRRALGRIEVFVTATRPDPSTMQAQARVRHEVGSSVPTNNPIDVYLRILNFGQVPGEQPYRHVAAVQGVPAGGPAK